MSEEITLTEILEEHCKKLGITPLGLLSQTANELDSLLMLEVKEIEVEE